jgi:hypothetical protein
MGDTDSPFFISHYFIRRFHAQSLDCRPAYRRPTRFVYTLLPNQLMNRSHSGIGPETLRIFKLDSPTASYSKNY